MKTFSKQSKKLRKFFHSAPLPRAILWILTLVFPIYMTLVANYISFGSRSMLSALITAQTGAFLLGLLLVYGVYFTFVFLFRRFSTAAGITGFLFILLPLIDHFKSIILQDHFYPWDLTLAQNAGSFTEFLGSISFPWQYILLFAVTILYWLFLHMTRPMLPIRSKVHFVGVPVLAALLVVFVTNTTVRGCYEPLFGIVVNEETDQDYIYDNYGFLTGFALNFGTVDTLMPQDYSEEVMAEMFAPFVPTGEEDTSDFENPDVIVVLSEAFWDPTKLEGVTFSDDPLKNYRAIAAEHPSGEMVSCTFGGGTIRPEFEIQSGMSTSTLPSGNMPYQQYLKEKTFSYAQLFKSLGYDTLGVHTYQKTFYERDRAYPLMGYDDFLGENDMHAELHWNSGPYITDQTIAEEIIYQLEQPHETGLYLTPSLWKTIVYIQINLILLTGTSKSAGITCLNRKSFPFRTMQKVSAIPMRHWVCSMITSCREKNPQYCSGTATTCLHWGIISHLTRPQAPSMRIKPQNGQTKKNTPCSAHLM